MAQLTPRFSTNRSVCEYTEKHYLPAATAYRSRIADKCAIGRQMVDWRHDQEQKWAALRFGDVKVRHMASTSYLRSRFASTSSIPTLCG